MQYGSVAILMLAACGGGGGDGGGGGEDDCAIVLHDRAHAMVRLSMKYSGEPTKATGAIEQCLAPTGSDCERVGKLFTEVPAMIPKWSHVDHTNAKAVCEAMPPALQKCLFPSYVLGHVADCKDAPAAAKLALASTKLPPPAK